MNEVELIIKKSLVAESERNDFFPNSFGIRLMMQAENLVYTFMSKLCSDYGGGVWDFYTLNNGGFYLAPRTTTDFHVIWPDNWFDGQMSADAAGIVASLFTINYLAFFSKNEEDKVRMSSAYYLLLEFANEHKESPAISGAID